MLATEQIADCIYCPQLEVEVEFKAEYHGESIGSERFQYRAAPEWQRGSS